MSQERLTVYLDELDEKRDTIGIVLNLAIGLLILISAAIFVAQTYPIGDRANFVLDIFQTAIIVIFAIEYCVRLWHASNKLAFFVDFYTLVDLAVLLSFVLGLWNISFSRIFRWLRILRLLRFLRGKSMFSSVANEDTIAALQIVFTLFSLIFIYSGIIYQVEHPVNAENFRTFFDALYFSIVTMTTVGFGDVTPISESGRIVTLMMILAGIALIPWQLGNLIRQFVRSGDRVRETCLGCGLGTHDADARFCKRCGSRLPGDRNSFGESG